MKIRKREETLRSQFNKSKLKFNESTYHYSSKENECAFIESQFQTPEKLAIYQRYRREWYCRSDQKDAGSFPLAVTCELVSICNLNCKMCYTRTPEFQNAIVGTQRILPWDVVVRIIDECIGLGVYSMLFSWRGESTLYRSKGSDGKWHDFADVLDYARKKGILEVTSLTNGRAFSDKPIWKTVKAQPNWISFSIDGLREEYVKIRQSVKNDREGDPFDAVISNLKKMVKLRDELGFSLPQIRTNTIYPPISKNPEKYRKFMEEIGVGLITVNELLDFRGAELPYDAIEDNWFCQYPFQRLVISANGVILPCPGAHNEEEELILGRYFGCPEKTIITDGIRKVLACLEISLIQAWNSDKMKKIRALHKANRRKEIWACKHCRHGAKEHGIRWIPEDWNMEKMEWTERAWRQD